MSGHIAADGWLIPSSPLDPRIRTAQIGAVRVQCIAPDRWDVLVLVHGQWLVAASERTEDAAHDTLISVCDMIAADLDSQLAAGSVVVTNMAAGQPIGTLG